MNGIKRMDSEVAPQAVGANVIDIRSTVTQRTGSECESARKPIRMEQKTLNLKQNKIIFTLLTGFIVNVNHDFVWH